MVWMFKFNCVSLEPITLRSFDPIKKESEEKATTKGDGMKEQ